MLVVVYAKLVKDRVPVSRARTRMLGAAHVEATEEHKPAVLRVLRVLQRLAWIRCAVDPTAKHAIRCKLEGRPAARLDVGDGVFGRAMEEERVAAEKAEAARLELERLKREAERARQKRIRELKAEAERLEEIRREEEAKRLEDIRKLHEEAARLELMTDSDTKLLDYEKEAARLAEIEKQEA